MKSKMETLLHDLIRIDEELKDQGRTEKACIVLPTYNEAENIERILDEILRIEKKQNKEDKVSFQVLVVDDSSPDGTADLVKKYRKKRSSVHLLLREEKEGLGAAYIEGMKHALEELEPDVIIEMDADFSHDPNDLLNLLQEVDNGADFVIGSRYVEGGETPDDWGAHRKLLSKCANIATRTILGIKNVEDCSGGFRAIRASLLERIGLDSLDVKGYAFQAALLEAAIYNGGTVREIPISFANREKGESKMRARDVLEGFTALTKLRAQRTFAAEEDFVQGEAGAAEAGA